MIKYLHVFFKLLSFCLLLTALNQATAQCPQRYRDQVFAKETTRLDNKYGINKQNIDSTFTWQAFDVYEPKDDTAQVRAVIMLIHGGGFRPPLDRRSPEIVAMARELAKRGYVVISPEYRLFGGSGSYKKITETVIAATFDINELMCYLTNSVSNSNPFRIDTSKFFMGGSSAGAMLALNFGLFVNDTSDFNSDYRQTVNRVATFDQVSAQTIFQNKFCGIEPKGIISLSGAFIDTNFIKPRAGNILLIHGNLDRILGSFSDTLSGMPTFGPGIFIDNLQQAGLNVEADIYPNKYHVPVLHPFLEELELGLQLILQTGTIFDMPVFDSTINHISNFCYNIMGSPVSNCITTSIKQNVIKGQLKIAPNPSNGQFNLELPITTRNKNVKLVVYDVNGEIIYQETMLSNGNHTMNLSRQAKGIYWMSLSNESTEDTSIYIDKLILQ